MNKAEWGFALIIAFNLYKNKVSFTAKRQIYFILPVIILLLQTVWLLPALDVRAQLHIDGLDVPSSYLHFVFPVLEVFKVISLSIFIRMCFTKAS